jgi:hypothetical protein
MNLNFKQMKQACHMPSMTINHMRVSVTIAHFSQFYYSFLFFDVAFFFIPIKSFTLHETYTNEKDGERGHNYDECKSLICIKAFCRNSSSSC